MVDLKKVADYVIETVQEESVLSGFQNIVEFKSIADKFNIKLDQNTIINVADLLFSREEVALIELDNNIKGFDIVLYTKYAPNYQDDDDNQNFEN